MKGNLTIYESKKFGTLQCDVYKNDDNELFMTREQIGTALEYTNPQKAISQIHDRNPDRLDSLSTVFSLRNVEGDRTVEREIICYSLRGVMEICRLSRQKKADSFMDFTWDIMESLYKGSTVLATPDQSVAITPDAMREMIRQELDGVLKEQERMNTVLVKVGMDLKRIATGSVLPEEEVVHTCKATTSKWRDDAVKCVKAIAKAKGIHPKVQLVLFYEKLTKEYGWCTDQERREFYQRNPGYGRVTVLQLIELHDQYRSIFESIVTDEYNRVVCSNSTALVVSESPAYALENKKDESVKQKEKDVTPAVDPISQLVMPIALALNDTTRHYKMTYSRIYEIMNVRWASVYTWYKKKHGVTTVPSKKKLTMESPSLLRKFKKAAQQLQDELNEK